VCATVPDSSQRSCNGAGAAGIQTVVCSNGYYESGTAGTNLGCTDCTDQTNCAVSTANTCSTTAGSTLKKICTSVTEAGYYLDGEVVKQCVDQTHCGTSTANTCSTTASYTNKTICTAVTDAGYYLDGQVVKACMSVQWSSASTCNAAGAAGIQTVTCNAGYYKSGTAGTDLACKKKAAAPSPKTGAPSPKTVGEHAPSPTTTESNTSGESTSTSIKMSYLCAVMVGFVAATMF
jgi:hypothetical protein